MPQRPADLFDRVEEWADLAALVERDTPGLRLGIVSGRRRYGKSYLLRRLAQASDGLYHQARELEGPQALVQFATDIADQLGLDPGTLRFDSWESGLRFALGMTRARGRAPRLLVIDELPYLLAHSPEIPSVLQLLYDEAANDPSAPAVTVILCGSSLSVMSDLLSGSKPLRGRAQLDLTMHSFDYRTARAYWGITDPRIAFELDAVLGGTPGYRTLVTAPPPGTPADLPAWFARQLLSPASALFDEKSFLLREDPRSLDRAIFNSILQAVAAGAHSTKEIGVRVGRDHNTLRHPMGVLTDTGFLLRVEDMLSRKRPHYFLADPVIRFAQVVLDPYRAQLEERQSDAVWHAAAAAYRSQVLGPHFEHLARVWTARYSGDRWGASVGEVGPAVVNDPAGRSQHQLDVLALPLGAGRHDEHAPIAVLGEAKCTNRLRSCADLTRLEHVRELLVRRGLDAADSHLALFSRDGFDEALRTVAGERADVHLIDLATLYGADGATPSGDR